MIYTSYFARLPDLIRNGIIPIAISRSVPKYYEGLRLMSLAPTWQMLKMSDADYDREYEKILAKHDRDKLVESFNGKDVALLCWEYNVNECHRKRVGEWLREGGYEVQEFGMRVQKKPPEKKRVEKEEENPSGSESTYQQLSFIF